MKLGQPVLCWDLGRDTVRLLALSLYMYVQIHILSAHVSIQVYALPSLFDWLSSIMPVMLGGTEQKWIIIMMIIIVTLKQLINPYIQVLSSRQSAKKASKQSLSQSVSHLAGQSVHF